MGAQRPTPRRLAKKLFAIRDGLGLSQNGMIERMGLADSLSREKVSAYERGERAPSLHVLLQYARAAGVWMDVLVDDELDLPAKLPNRGKRAGIARKGRRKQ
jgi:transcriptional regulator with XRE-family HTH domain